VKKIAGNIVISIIVLSIALWFIASEVNKRHAKAKKQKIIVEQRVETDNAVYAMVKKYNAISDWRDKFQGRISLFDATYTVEVQNAIVKTDGRPILFLSSLNDIVQHEGKYFLYFGNWFAGLSELDIQFILECTPAQAEKIMTGPKETSYAVVAQITEVEKIRFQLTSATTPHEEIDIKFAPSNVFMARGRFLDFELVGNHGAIF